MTRLADLAVSRASLPLFPGTSYPEQLANGRGMAEAILRQYVPDLSFDVARAEETIRQVAAWQERNQAVLDTSFADASATHLPAQACLALGSDRAQAYILAQFTLAASGLGPWMSGAVAREVEQGVRIQLRWAQEDAQTRLQVFGAIVKMETDGYLKTLFRQPAPGTPQTSCGSGASGFGFVPVVIWAVAVVLIAVAALFLVYRYAAERMQANNRLLADLCKEAQKRGDQETIAKCVDATRALQADVPGLSEVSSAVGKAVVVAAVVGAGYLLWQVWPRGRAKVAR